MKHINPEPAVEQSRAEEAPELVRVPDDNDRARRRAAGDDRRNAQ